MQVFRCLKVRNYRYNFLRRTHRYYSRPRSNASKPYRNLSELRLEFSQIDCLPTDENSTHPITPRPVPSALFAKTKPTAIDHPKLAAVSQSALVDCLHLNPKECQSNLFTQIMAGNEFLPNSQPFAHCYAGFQFGNYAGQLGDGRAMSLGEVINEHNTTSQRWELQLKGVGRTPFSRFADGRAVLRSSIREFLASEHMNALGIPTTRAASLVVSERSHAIRDPFYNGNIVSEKCAVVSRLSPSFTRFGSFEICHDLSMTNSSVEGPSVGEKELLRMLADYVIEYHFPHLLDSDDDIDIEDEPMTVLSLEGGTDESVSIYEKWFSEVMERTIEMVVGWQTCGFTHGVLNTDNMSILGVTIDYGPYGWMEYFSPCYVPNTSDTGRRYAYNKQVSICKWNLFQLAKSLDFGDILPLSIAQKYLTNYDTIYWHKYSDKVFQKMGLYKRDSSDIDLLTLWFETLEITAADMTNCFRALSIIESSPHNCNPNKAAAQNEELLQTLLSNCASLERYRLIQCPQYNNEQLIKIRQFLKANPTITRLGGLNLEDIALQLESNLKTEQKIALSSEAKKRENDLRLWNEFVTKYRQRVDWDTADIDNDAGDDDDVGDSGNEIDLGNEERLINHESKSKTKTDMDAFNAKRCQKMNRVNPKYILRNYILQSVIDESDNNGFNSEFSELKSLFNVMTNPYQDQPEANEKGWDKPSPDDSPLVSLSCSS